MSFLPTVGLSIAATDDETSDSNDDNRRQSVGLRIAHVTAHADDAVHERVIKKCTLIKGTSN